MPGYAGIWKADAASGAVARVYTSRLRFNRESGVVGEVPRLAGWSHDGEMILLWRGPCSASTALPLGVDEQSAYLADPTLGYIAMPLEQFVQAFSGPPIYRRCPKPTNYVSLPCR